MRNCHEKFAGVAGAEGGREPPARPLGSEHLDLDSAGILRLRFSFALLR
jgi:hypothetical protein